VITELQVCVRRSPAGAAVQDDVLSVSKSEDVDELIALLKRPDSDDAYVTHLGRSTKVDELDGDDVPDHVMYLAIRGDLGYLRYVGTLADGHPADAYTPVGDERSPATHGTNNTDYPAGSGLPLSDVRAIVTNFLTTGTLPNTVSWRDEAGVVAHAAR
jgi:hypothetical protein